MPNQDPRDEFALTSTADGLFVSEADFEGTAPAGNEVDDAAAHPCATKADHALADATSDAAPADAERAEHDVYEDEDSEQDLSDNGDENGDEEAVQEEAAPAGPTFANLGLPQEILDAVTDLGFVHPTPIQAQAIPPLLAGRDVVGVAQTGTGKTAAFGLPLLADLTGDKAVEAIVLAPTRELALQTADALESFAATLPTARVLAVYGGSSYEPQLRGLRAGANVVVGTPGRVIDLIERGALNLDSVKFLVLDEADEMLRMGFAEDVETIASGIPAGRRTALFSATMPPAIKKIADTHLTDPVRVTVARQSSTVSTVEQEYAVVPFRHKVGALSRVLATSNARAAIVFVRTKSAAEEVALELGARGVTAAAISGDVPQRERERIVERLREGTLKVLVATDVAARGLDVERLDLVVNFDVPREAEAYVHRTGRAGRTGRALTFLTPKEKSRLRQIERLTGTELTEIALPTPRDVSLHRAGELLGRLQARAAKGRLDIYREAIADLLAGNIALADVPAGQSEDAPAPAPMELAEAAAALLALAIGDEGPERTEKEDKRRTRKEEEVDEDGEFIGARFEPGRDSLRSTRSAAERGGRRSRLATRYRVEVGHKDKAAPGAIVGAITGETGLSGSDVGKIDIFPSFSLVEISADLSPEARRRLHKAVVAGRQLRLREDDGPRGGRGFGRGFDKSDRFERGERPERFDKSDRFDQSDRFEKVERGERGFDRTERPERFERKDRGERFARDERADYDGNLEQRRAKKFEGVKRFDRADRAGRFDRPARGKRGERFEGGGRFDKSERYDRGERSERFERGERGDRFERGERGFEGRKARSFERSFEHGARKSQTRGFGGRDERGFKGRSPKKRGY
ncbi:MAG: DEAD/DEAH box helicase [Buchananella hordeovulneris]|nr:DEAD/DEAH box helicase [Buchananella hordeovulneris]